MGGGEVLAVSDDDRPWVTITTMPEDYEPGTIVAAYLVMTGLEEGMSAYEKMKAERDALQARVEELEAEVEKLKAAARSGSTVIVENYSIGSDGDVCSKDREDW
jgi:hypothetical protein